ncbi:MAG: NAD-dependent epimerase/dehydratase family protein [Sandaracinus sp.]|nr:NAD-dependent epimerase/dehydratase family protein [Sandaracinus sp.]MCB9634241.1 NAD-dependent epimerase/dehydratase family protein [Sandaracinus sp.]
MSDKKIQVGIVGAGYISEPHLVGLQHFPDLEVVAICDLSRGRAEALAARFGVPKVYLDMEEMLRSEKLDVAHVLTPPEVHERIATRLLEAGVDVLLEKPMCSTSEECARLAAVAKRTGRKLGTSHNFLFFDPYEQLRDDLRAGRLGAIDQVDIVWNKELGQVKFGPHTGWLFARPENVLLEVGPHTFTQVLDLVGEPERLSVSVGDHVELPLGREFYRRWEAIGWKGTTSIRLRWSFIGGFPEHYIHVRGRSASAVVDFERNTYVRTSHTAQMLDLDRFAISVSHAKQEFLDGAETLGRYLLGKLGVVKGGKVFADSIANAARTFYDTRTTTLDSRLDVDLSAGAVALAERVGREAKLPETTATAPAPVEREVVSPKILVLGGTGFIGRALVKRLTDEGHAVRVLARDPRSPHPELAHPRVEVVRGDFTDTKSVEAALGGIEVVYHLARGHGSKWEEYEKYDVEPTVRLAEACASAGVRRFFYTSTIAIYWAGKRAKVITEETPPHPGILRTQLYSRSKVAIERELLALGEKGPLEIVIFRPGVVIGSGGSPLHWGVGAWPYPSVCRLWGDGEHDLPFVLADDCADAMVLALDTPNLHQQSFNLVGDAKLTGHQYLDALERKAGIKVKRVAASPAVLLAEEAAKWAIKSLGRDAEARLPSWYDGDGRTLAAHFDCTKAKQRLGWKPVGDVETLIAKGIHVPVEEFLL